MVAPNHQGPRSRFTRYLSGESWNNIHGFMAKSYIALIAYAVVLATAHADHGTPDRPVLHASADGRRHSAAAPIGGYRRGLPEQTHCAARRAFEELGSHIGTAASRAGVIQLEQGRISRPWQPGCRDKPLAALDCPWAPHVPASPARMGRPGCTCVPLGHAPSDRGRQLPPRPGCLIPCHPVSPVSLPGLHGGLFLLHVLLQRPARKRPSPY